VLATIQDKLQQRWFFRTRGLPVPRFVAVDRPTAEDAHRFCFPLVQKARRGGYDGRGVVVLRGPKDLADLLPVPSVFEECVAIEKEIAVLVARSPSGETCSYPAVEMIFDPRLNLIEGLLFPGRLDEATAERARLLATRTVEALDGVGIFAVELFLDRDGSLWLNEVAPRPHNSGHATIEASVTCQFEQHVRAVTGMPLGDTSLIHPAAMVNLTGPEAGEGDLDLPGLAQALSVPGARLHLYGKSTVRPGRKMGHVTVLDENPLAALDRAREARRLLGLRAREAA
jgi:5-(carboxyamino)imidazole ribonucleotide synthase